MKIQTILLLYDALMRGETLSRTEFCALHKISERTFYRYMREISRFLRQYRPDCIVDIMRDEGKYFLKK